MILDKTTQVNKENEINSNNLQSSHQSVNEKSKSANKLKTVTILLIAYKL